MLRVESLRADDYLGWVAMGPSEVTAKSTYQGRHIECSPAGLCAMADGIVKNDTFRTLATDTQFKGKVKEDMLIRLLEAFVWKNQGQFPYVISTLDVADALGSERDGLPFTYVQGESTLGIPSEQWTGTEGPEI